MPEDSKKNQHKGKHEAKEQRKPRHQRQHAGDKSEKKTDKKVEEPKRNERKIEEKIASAPPKPVYEEPGPEFYSSLKRETDEILKITEEANAKYKKKEIQSNWSKYEMPIESYEEMEEQENLGADYEKLIQAPMSAGGHFQFKHEKTWDINTAPSLYDNYFEINMDNLATAISTIPFFERSNIDKSVFSQIDLTTMNNRAVKFKRKYYKDKSYTTPELEAQDTILNLMKDGVNSNEETGEKSEDLETKSDDIVLETNKNSRSVNKASLETKHNDDKSAINIESVKIESNTVTLENEDTVPKDNYTTDKLKSATNTAAKELDDIDEVLFGDVAVQSNTEYPPKGHVTHPQSQLKVTEDQPTESNKPVIESPEDLEKWLDDFLDE